MLNVKDKRNYLKDDIIKKIEVKISDHKKSVIEFEQKILDLQFMIDNLKRAKQIVVQTSMDEMAVSRIEAIEMIYDLLNGGMLY